MKEKNNINIKYIYKLFLIFIILIKDLIIKEDIKKIIR